MQIYFIIFTKLLTKCERIWPIAIFFVLLQPLMRQDPFQIKMGF